MEESIGKRIKRLRESLQMTQAQVADRIGVSRVAVTKWESGDTQSLKFSNLSRLLQLFAISYDELVGKVQKPDLPRPVSLVQATEQDGGDASTKEERQLLDAFRQLSSSDRSRILFMVMSDAAFFESQAKATQPADQMIQSG
jgi:transcriptional regulator with XRE-family HTH domain